MQIALGCDHRGLRFKQNIITMLGEWGYGWEDFGTYDAESVDYPDIAQRVSEGVVKGHFSLGILICSTGIGMSISANKVNGIRAALCHNAFTAHHARLHNDANILCLGEDVVEPSLLEEIVRAFLDTMFEGGRHSCRVDKMMALEEKGSQ